MVLPLPGAWPGGLPALGPGGRWTPRHATGRQRQATEPTKSAIDQVAGHGSARVPGWLVECLRLGVGHASTVRPDPSTLGRGGRTRLPPRGPLVDRLKPPESVSAQSVLAVTRSDLLTIC